VALVSEGSRGVGGAVVRLDAAAGGVQVAFSYRRDVEAAWAVAQGMRTAGRDAIVFVSSTTTVRPPGSAPYTAAKAALEAAASVLAIEEREHGIRINVVAPGLVATDMGDRLVRASSLSAAGGRAGAAVDLDTAFSFGRVCRPEDVADVVAFLVGNSSSYVAGHRVVVDGGGAAGALLPASQS
jgi:3-oxoacyl-[acyl-carrier protein] reductase